MTAPRHPWSFSLRTKIIAAILLVGIAIGLILPALQPGREGCEFKWKREEAALRGETVDAPKE